MEKESIKKERGEGMGFSCETLNGSRISMDFIEDTEEEKDILTKKSIGYYVVTDTSKHAVSKEVYEAVREELDKM